MAVPDRFKDLTQKFAEDPDLLKGDPSLDDDHDDDLANGADELDDDAYDAALDAESKGEDDTLQEGDGLDEEGVGVKGDERDQRRRPQNPTDDDLRRDNGRLRAELERLRQQSHAEDQRRQQDTIAALQREIADLKAQRAAPPEPAPPILTDEEIDLLGGPETAKALMRAAEQIAERKFSESAAPLQQRLETMGQQAIATREAMFLSKVRQHFPDIDKLRDDPNWLAFASSSPPGISGKTYGEFIYEAHKAEHLDAVVSILNAYDATRHRARALAGERNGRPAAPATQQQPARPRLGDYAQPSKSGVSTPGQTRARPPNDDDVSRWTADLQRGLISFDVYKRRMARLNSEA